MPFRTIFEKVKKLVLGSQIPVFKASPSRPKNECCFSIITEEEEFSARGEVKGRAEERVAEKIITVEASSPAVMLSWAFALNALLTGTCSLLILRDRRVSAASCSLGCFAI